MAGTSRQLAAINYPGRTSIRSAIAGDSIIWDVREIDLLRVSAESIEAWPGGFTAEVKISTDGGSTYYTLPDASSVFSASGATIPLDVRAATHAGVFNTAVAGTATVLVSAIGYKEI